MFLFNGPFRLWIHRSHCIEPKGRGANLNVHFNLQDVCKQQFF
jgi:hypothetical protein